MAVATQSHALSALKVANATREVRAKQLRALRGAPPRTMLPVLIDPPAELASYRLWEIFARYGRGLIPLFAAAKLDHVLASLNRRCPGRNWHKDMRLRSLSKTERRMLAQELMHKGPGAWRKS